MKFKTPSLFAILALTPLLSCWIYFAGTLTLLNVCYAFISGAAILFLLIDMHTFKRLGYYTPTLGVVIFFITEFYLGQIYYEFLVSNGLTHRRTDAAILETAKIFSTAFLVIVAVWCLTMLFTTMFFKKKITFIKYRLLKSRASIALFTLGCIALLFSLLFFYTKGIPILSDNVEQNRIDATSGSNYIFAGLLQFVNLSLLAIVFYYPKHKIKIFIIVLFSATFLLATGYRAPAGGILTFCLIWYSYTQRRIGLLMGIVLTNVLSMIGLAAGLLRAFMSNIPIVDFKTFLYSSGSVSFREIAFSIDTFEKVTFSNTYLAALLLFIPRALYPDKPDGIGVVLRNELYGESFKGGAIRVTQIGESFLNLGYPGLIVIMGIVGGFAFFLSRRLVRVCNSGERSAIFLGIIINIVWASLFYGDSAQAVFVFFRDFVIIWLAVRFAFRKIRTGNNIELLPSK